MSILITGGAGFIGSHLVRRMVRSSRVICFDKLTYAGNLANLADLMDHPNFVFEQGDIIDAATVRAVLSKYGVTAIIHLAAESHVDRSILDPLEFVRTNVVGTATLLEASRERIVAGEEFRLFHHVSTDEVYGSLGATGSFVEDTPYDPRSPYSASKAGSDHLAQAFHSTYGLPVVVSNCSNNYGPNQFPEKLIPLCLLSIIEGRPIPVYGQGLNVRDWLYVEDHAEALELIFLRGRPGERYNVGGSEEWCNIDLVRKLCQVADEMLGRPVGTSEETIQFVKDRAGHDFRYAVDTTKIREELGWVPKRSLESGLRETVAWYLANGTWLQEVASGAYRTWSQRQYGTAQ